MVDGFYRIGQASKQLGVSSYHLRRLCQAGAIEAEQTSGNQWRVPISEVERLQRDGVPPIPQIVDAEPEEDDAEEDRPPARVSDRRPRDGLYAAPSDGVIDAAEDVAITENRLRKRRLERELEVEEDFFRERAARDRAQAEAERERARKEHDLRKRRAWENDWITHALNRVPRDAPRELELEVHAQASEVLARLQPDHPTHAVLRLIDAAVEKALAPWRFQIRQCRAIEAALATLPFDLLHGRDFAAQRNEAARLATAAMTQCRPDAPFDATVSVAVEAVKPIVRAFEHARASKEVIGWTSVRGASLSELDEAKDLVRAALSHLPVGCSRAQMERAREQALIPLAARIAERDRAEAARAEERRRRQQAEWRVDFQIGHIERYLDETYEYPTIHDRFADARRLKEKIRPTLVAECIADPDLDTEDIRSRIEELVDELI